MSDDQAPAEPHLEVAAARDLEIRLIRLIGAGYGRPKIAAELRVSEGALAEMMRGRGFQCLPARALACLQAVREYRAPAAAQEMGISQADLRTRAGKALSWRVVHRSAMAGG